MGRFRLILTSDDYELFVYSINITRILNRILNSGKKISNCDFDLCEILAIFYATGTRSTIP
jgi:hypothetical protein